MSNLTRRQRLILVVLTIESFVLTACVSVEAPFYPKIAMQKSCTMTEIGFVFSIFELVVFIISPIIGKYLNKWGNKPIYVGGLCTLSMFSIIFGFLNNINDHSLFLATSLLIRSIEAVGFGASVTARNSVIAQEFPFKVGSTTAIIDASGSLGVVFGLSFAGVLNQLGGYTIPFAAYGGLLFLIAIFVYLVLPTSYPESNKSSKVGYSILSAIKIPRVRIILMAIVTTSITFGFVEATLEPFVRQFNLKPSILGLVFMLPFFVYAVTGVLIGRICDSIASPTIVIIVGAVLQILCCIIIGPAPFVPIEPTLILVIVGLLIHGLGLATQYIGTFVEIFRSILAEGYSNDLKTHGLVSGIWTSADSLGAFLGAAIGGVLVDNFGFRNACMHIMCCQAIIGIVLFGYTCIYKAENYLELNDDEAMEVDLTTHLLSKK